MWIKGWSIDAFGHLEHTGADDLSTGLNVVVGPNESGKTTTLHFLRWVLFGFPSPKSNVFRHYKPASGDFGGRIQIGHEDRIIGVERHHRDQLPILTSADGSALKNTTWNDVVGAAGPELFESVFAITTAELQSIAELNTNEVREQIYAAGTVGHGRSARSVLAELEKANATLLSRRKGRIRELHDNLARRSEELGDAIERAKGLDQRWADVAALLEAAQQHDSRHQQLDATRVHLLKLIESWPSWVQGSAAERELEEMAPPVDLPPEPTAALAAATEEVERLEKSRDSAREVLRSTEAAIEEIKIDDRLAEVSARARQLDKLAPTMADRDRQLSAKRAELDLVHNDVVARLGALGPDWTAEATTTIDVSPRASQEAGEHADTLAETRTHWNNAVRELDIATTAHKEVTAQVAAAEAELSDASSHLHGITDTAAARRAVLELQGLVPRLEQAEARAADAYNYERLTRHLESGTPSAFVPPIVLPILIVVAILCVIGAGASLLTNSLVGGVALLIVAIGLVVLADVVRTATRIPDDGPQNPDTPTSSSPQTSNEESQLNDLAAAVDSSAARAGFEHRPTPQALNDLLIALDHQQRIEGDLKSLRARLAQCAVELEATVERERFARRRARGRRRQVALLENGSRSTGGSRVG